MRCNVCGREIPPGQMFCQCGNTVTPGQGSYGQKDNNQSSYQYDYTAGAGDLDVNRSPNKTMFIAIAAGIVVFVVIIAILVSTLLSAGNNITDPTKWETVSNSHYQMTRPKSMKEVDVKIEKQPSVTDLGTFRSGDVVMNIGTYQFTAEQRKYVKRKKAAEQLKEMLPSVMGSDATVQERGSMCYTEKEMQLDGVFFGSDKAEYVAAYYVTQNGLYVVQVITPISKYPKYHDAIFTWMDSFRPV